MSVSLIALHGNGGGGFRFARSEAHYPPEIRLSTPTLPGFAGVPRNPAVRTMRDYAAVLHEHIRTQSEPRVLLGTGIGGAIVLEYLQHHGDSLAGAILHAPVGTRLDERLFPRLMRLPGMTTLGKLTFSSQLTRPIFKRLLFSEPVPDDYLNTFFDEYGRCEVFGQMFEIITSAWFQSLGPSDVPTALLWGEREKVLSVDQLDDYKRLLPNHLVRTVPDWDHFPMIETPAEWAEVTTELCYQLVGDGA